MKYLVMLSSMPFESELVCSRLRKMKEISISGRTAFSAQYGSWDILLLHTGIGKVNAAHSLTLLMENCQEVVLKLLAGREW